MRIILLGCVISICCAHPDLSYASVIFDDSSLDHNKVYKKESIEKPSLPKPNFKNKRITSEDLQEPPLLQRKNSQKREMPSDRVVRAKRTLDL